MSKQTFWKTLKESTVYSTPWLTVKEETVQLPHGEIVDNYSVVEFRNVAMVFPLFKGNEVIMVRQYRHGVRKILLELPAGTYDSEREDPETAAKRELWEETGYRTKNLSLLGTVYDYPTKDRHSVSIYFTDDLTFEPTTHKEATEDIEVVKVPLSELEEYIEKGEIAVSGTITAIHLAKEYLQKNEP